MRFNEDMDDKNVQAEAIRAKSDIDARHRLWGRISNLLFSRLAPTVRGDYLSMGYMVYHQAVLSYEPSRKVPFVYFYLLCLRRYLRDLRKKELRRSQHEVLECDLCSEEDDDSEGVSLEEVQSSTPADDPWSSAYERLLCYQIYQRLQSNMSREIFDLLSEGFRPAEIARRVGCSVYKVYRVRSRVRAIMYELGCDVT